MHELPASAPRRDGTLPGEGGGGAGRLRPLVALLHPLPSAATVLVALALALPYRARSGALAPHPGRRLALLGAMMTAQQLAISLHNDWCDRDVDRVAKPWRAIPAGAPPPARCGRWPGPWPPSRCSRRRPPGGASSCSTRSGRAPASSTTPG